MREETRRGDEARAATPRAAWARATRVGAVRRPPEAGRPAGRGRPDREPAFPAARRAARVPLCAALTVVGAVPFRLCAPWVGKGT